MEVQTRFVVLRTVTEMQNDVGMTSQNDYFRVFSPCLVIILPKYTINLTRTLLFQEKWSKTI